MTRKPGQDPQILLRVAEHFLRRRHFNDCRKYAHHVHKINPNFPGVSQILAVADVLLAANNKISTGNLTDWYAIMQLNRYTHNLDLITQRFNHLYAILNPSNNKFPFADEAFDFVTSAWCVLSNDVKKLEYDDNVRKLLNDEKSKSESKSESKSKGNCDFVFWTVCPYCYCCYEYPRVYLELCLRCDNEKCLKAFTCVEIDKPPNEVLMEGKYLCSGFLPVSSQNGSWSPFVPLRKEKSNVGDNADKFIEISDDDDDCGDVEVESKNEKSCNGNGEGVESVKVKVEKPTTAKVNVTRKKSVAKKTKKVTGAGNRVSKEGFVDKVERDRNVRYADNEDDGCENDFRCEDHGEPIDLLNVGEVEYFDADGDIFVSFQNGNM